jgi:hypothetical protein
MSMMELMQQGGAPPPGPEAGGDPMAALMGGAPAPEEAPVEDAGMEEGDESTDYQSAIDALSAALNRPTTDQQEMAEIQKCIAAIQGLLGKNEKMMDSALGTNPQLRKALAGGGAG